jgi:hypothetical protein
MRTILAVTAVLCVLGSSAEAHGRHHHHHHHHYVHHHHHLRYHHYIHRGEADRHFQYAGRPRAWCGWYMRSQVGGDPGPSYNLARSWAHYGASAGGPQVGAIVVWRHHVGKIVGHENGKWIVQSGNDGHAVRTRPRSLAGAIAFRNAYASAF